MALNTNIASDIFAKCVPAASVDASRIDGITMTNIEPTAATKTALESIYADPNNNYWRIIGNLLEADFRGAACQKRINGFADWIKGTSRVIDSKKMSVSNLKTGLYDVRPFIQMEVKNPINNHYWSFNTGTAQGGGANTPNTNEAYDWKGIVASQRGIPADVRWFGRRTVVTISGRSGTDNHVIATYKVLDSEISGGNLIVYLKNIGSNTDDPIYNLVNGGDKRSNVTSGVMVRGLPNVTQAESYCDNIPGLNMKQFKPFWIQHTRRSIREDDEYLKYVQLIRENNPYFRQFGDVDSVEYARQVMEDYDNRLANSFLQNPVLANQTMAGYASLEKVEFYVGDTNSPTFSWQGRYHLRRANAAGYLEQLAECDGPLGTPRLQDLAGTKIDLGDFHNELYEMQRVRQSNGIQGNVMEVWVDSRFREELVDGYLTYFKNKSQSLLNINQELTAKLEQNALGFTWRTINLDFPGVQLKLVSHPFLDDWVDAHGKASEDAGGDATAQANMKETGSLLIVPDWSTTYRALLDSGTVTMETGDPKEIAKVDAALLCGPLTAPKQRVKHYWEIFTQIVECPASQLAYENFDRTGVDQPS